MEFMESVAMEEMIIYVEPATEPAVSPAPSTPAATSAEVQSQMNSGAPSPSDADPRIKKRRPRIKRIWLPEVARVVHWNVDYLRIHRLNLDRRLTVLIFGHHFLLRRVGELAGIPGARPQALNGAHHIGLLGQEGVAQIGGPADIGVQP